MTATLEIRAREARQGKVGTSLHEDLFQSLVVPVLSRRYVLLPPPGDLWAVYRAVDPRTVRSLSRSVSPCSLRLSLLVDRRQKLFPWFWTTSSSLSSVWESSWRTPTGQDRESSVDECTPQGSWVDYFSGRTLRPELLIPFWKVATRGSWTLYCQSASLNLRHGSRRGFLV